MREEFKNVPKDTDVLLGERFVLECSAPRGHPAPVIKWKKDGENFDLTSSKRVKIDGSGNLVVQKAENGDQGRYQCSAENVAATRVSNPVRVRVQGKFFLPFVAADPEERICSCRLMPGA